MRPPVDRGLSPSDRPRPLVGRVDERAQLSAALARAGGGEAVLAVVAGAAGMGKTALLRDLTASIGDGTRLLLSSAEEAEARLDLGVVEQLVGEAGALGVAVGPLDRDMGSSDPLRAGAAVHDLLETVTDDGPVVVLVDDAQWCDPPSVRALTFALRRIPHRPVLVVVAHRPDAPVLEPLLRLAADREGPRLRLQGLGAADLRRAVAERSGVAVPWRAGERIWEHTRGNPLEAITLAEELDAAELLSGLGPLPAPRSYASLILNRLAGASPEVEALVAALAVLGRPVSVGQLDEVRGGRTAASGAALDAAVDQGFVVRERRAGTIVVDVAHPLLRAAVLDDLAPGRQAELHGRAAQATVEPVRRMVHRLAAVSGRDPALGREAVALARGCAADGRSLSAIDLLVAAADLFPEGAEADEARLLAADELLDQGDTSTARELLGRIATEAEGAHAQLLEGHIALLEGDPATATRALRRAWESGGERAGRAALLLATVASNTAQADRALEWGRAALEGTAGRRDPGHALTMVATAWALRGDLAAGHEEVAGWRRALGAPQVRVPEGLLLLWDGSLVEARRTFEAWISGPGGTHSHLVDATARYALADTLYRLGDWDASLDLARRLATTLDDAELLLAAPMAHSVAAFVLAGRGSDQGVAHLVRARAAIEANGNGSGLLWEAVATARAAEARGDAAQVVAHLGVLAELTADLALPEGVQPWRADLVEALVAVGDLDRAEGEADALADRLVGGGAHARGGALRARAVLAVARGDRAGADALFEEGLAEDPVATGAFVRARLELAAGASWRRRGARRRAADVLRAAAERFDDLGAAPYSLRVRRELASSGLAPRARDAAPSSLTPAELSVARLVAQGATNREVAAELFISVKTVETHLGRVYAKLGIRSRSGLASMGADALGPPPP